MLFRPAVSAPYQNAHFYHINGHFLRESGAGTFFEMDEVSKANVRGFLEQLDAYRARIDRALVCGNDAAMRAIQKHIPNGSHAD